MRTASVNTQGISSSNGCPRSSRPAARPQIVRTTTRTITSPFDHPGGGLGRPFSLHRRRVMEPDINEAYSSFARNDDHVELNFDDPDEHPNLQFTDSAPTGTTPPH